jgi:hypothetical protein
VEDRVDPVDFDALARRRDGSEVDTCMARHADRIEAVQLEQAPEHRAHRGQETLARRSGYARNQNSTRTVIMSL